jgi:preprotein translocase subunit SecG
MKIQWQKILVKITFWLIVEIILNLLGLDNLADYSEFVFEGHSMAGNNYTSQVTSEI